jgi:hypothetical protein
VDGQINQGFRTADDVDATFAEAVVHCHGGHTVLGFRLWPFSFWHAANLDFVESPFAGHNKPIDFAALYVACRICQLRYPATFRKRKLEYLVELWKARRYRPVKITRRALRALRKVAKRKGGLEAPPAETGRMPIIHPPTFPLLRELNKFSAYVRDYSSRPDYVAGEDSTPVKTPWYLYEAALYRRFNPETTWAQAWNIPIGQASWFNAGMLEASGQKLEILTPEMRKAFNYVEDEEAKLKAV